MADDLMERIRTKRLIVLLVEAERGHQANGDGDVTLVEAKDAALLRGTPDVTIASDGPEVGGKTHCTDFYFHGYHFRHVFLLPDPDDDDGGLPEGWEEMFHDDR